MQKNIKKTIVSHFKTLSVFILNLTAVEIASACDFINYQNAANKKNIEIECEIQDRFQSLKKSFKDKFNININDIAEYKVMRFIDRTSWENAKKQNSPPKNIYRPAPITWNIWNDGIEKIFPYQTKNIFFQDNFYQLKTYSELNKILLMNENSSSQDDKTDMSKKPGEYRKSGDSDVAFCSHEYSDYSIYRSKLDLSTKSLETLQANWEKIYGMKLTKLIEQNHGLEPGIATLAVSLRNLVPGCGDDGKGVHASYVRSDSVEHQLQWLFIFLKANFDLYKKGKMILTPVQLAALAQKWFVTIHPFADGNGRTSRALEDLILGHFDLPYASSGDLQNDALEDYDTYILNHYQAFERTLTQLESCFKQYENKNVSFQCRTTIDLNR